MPKRFERRTVTPEMAREKIAKWPRHCAWKGCAAAADGELPPDWLNLITYWSPWAQPHLTMVEATKAPYCMRDAVLCGEHARELEICSRRFALTPGSTIRRVAPNLSRADRLRPRGGARAPGPFPISRSRVAWPLPEIARVACPKPPSH